MKNELIIGLIVIAVLWIGWSFAVATHNFQKRVDECVVAEFESQTGKERTELYDYCRANARSQR